MDRIQTMKNNYFVSVQSTGLYKDSTPISISVVDYAGNFFYGEFTDYDRRQLVKTEIDDGIFIRYSVIDSLICDKKEYMNIPDIKGSCEIGSIVKGTFYDIHVALTDWISKMSTVNESDIIQFISDCPTYDHMHLTDILVYHALRYNDLISPVIVDLNQIIADHYFEESNEKYMDAFDFGRYRAIENILDDDETYMKIFGRSFETISQLPEQNAIRVAMIRRILFEILSFNEKDLASELIGDNNISE